MSDKEDLSEVTVTQSESSWGSRGERERRSCCARYSVPSLWASVCLLALAVSGLTSLFWIYIFPRVGSSENQYSVHLLPVHDVSSHSLSWLSQPGVGHSHQGSGFQLSGGRGGVLRTSREGMYYVYLRLTLSCSVRGECPPAEVRVRVCAGEEGHPCTENVLDLTVRLAGGPGGGRGGHRDQASGFEASLARISPSTPLHLHLTGAESLGNVRISEQQTYFGAFLVTN